MKIDLAEKKKYFYEIMTLKALPGEKWKSIKDFPRYEVSNYGRIKSVTCEKYSFRRSCIIFYPERIRKQYISKKGYLTVGIIDKNGKFYTKSVARLVAMAFLPNPLNLPEVNHLNEDKLCNTVYNLKWTSAKENNNWATRITRSAETRRGQKHSAETKDNLSIKMGRPVMCDGIKFTSIKRCAEHYKMWTKTIARWLSGKSPMPQEWKKRGLKYVED